jgi:hypothetical protein
MSMVHIANADGSHYPLEESQVFEMLRQGQLSPETFYWKEGMADWRPLGELTPPVPRAAVPPKSVAPRYYLSKSIEPLATIVQVLLVVYLVVVVINLYEAYGQMLFVFAPTVHLEAARTHDRWMRIFALVSLGIYLYCAVPFGMWIYRSARNCHGFARGMSFTPGMSVGSYFIPFANLVLPCQAMQEIWKASCNPARWQTERNSVLIGFWWAFWLATGITGSSFYYLPKVHDRGTLETNTTVLIILYILKVILVLLAIAMVRGVTQKQKKLTEPAG